jgi:hypothetical protein
LWSGVVTNIVVKIIPMIIDNSIIGIHNIVPITAPSIGVDLWTIRLYSPETARHTQTDRIIKKKPIDDGPLPTIVKIMAINGPVASAQFHMSALVFISNPNVPPQTASRAS